MGAVTPGKTLGAVTVCKTNHHTVFSYFRFQDSSISGDFRPPLPLPKIDFFENKIWTAVLVPSPRPSLA